LGSFLTRRELSSTTSSSDSTPILLINITAPFLDVSRSRVIFRSRNDEFVVI
jgi:hypothetical protein